MKELIERSYQAIRKRGLITPETEMTDFIAKMTEELAEVKHAHVVDKSIGNTVKETVDLMNVCICALKHHGFDPIEEFRKCVEWQEARKD